MAQRLLYALLCGRFGQKLPRFEIMQTPLENPWIALCAAPNHDGITACMLQQIFGILWCEDISVANDGNLHRRQPCLDEIPIRLAAVILLSGSAMHCHRGRAV